MKLDLRPLIVNTCLQFSNKHLKDVGAIVKPQYSKVMMVRCPLCLWDFLKRLVIKKTKTYYFHCEELVMALALLAVESADHRRLLLPPFEEEHYFDGYVGH